MIFLKEIEVLKEIYIIYGLSFWFVKFFEIAVNNLNYNELKINPLTIKINELLVSKIFKNDFEFFNKMNVKTTFLNKYKYNLINIKKDNLISNNLKIITIINISFYLLSLLL